MAMPRVKRVPIRMCVGCRARNEKRSLVRVVRTPEGEVVLDLSGKQAGRGAYVCRDPGCLKKAFKSKALERGLGISLSPVVLAQLEEEIKHVD